MPYARGRVRWAVYVPSEMSKEFEGLSEEFGMTKSQLALMLIKLGRESFLRAYKPELVIDQEQLAKLIGNAINGKPGEK
jgi:hypothetical protein